jgi:hypothetical protein
VDQAIAKGVGFLKQCLTGEKPDIYLQRSTGAAALAGLTLLNCGVKATDPALQQVLSRVRDKSRDLNARGATYEIAICVWFLDRLNEPRDKPLIKSLALRLIGGQDAQGGWDYTCPKLSSEEEEQLLVLLKSKDPSAANAPQRLKGLPVLRVRPGREVQLGQPAGRNDNSLAQFAVLALWAAQKHGVPAGRSLALAEARFRACQASNGSWGYLFSGRSRVDSMTCAGLVALAAGRGVSREKRRPVLEDGAVKNGFRFLAQSLGRKPQGRGAGGRRGRLGRGTLLGASSWGDLYYLWSVERVGMIYDLREIEGIKWYNWGVEVLLPAQQEDGSWHDSFAGVVDTSFALLFLKRVNVAEDLTEKIKLGA